MTENEDIGERVEVPAVEPEKPRLPLRLPEQRRTRDPLPEKLVRRLLRKNPYGAR